MSTTIKFIAVLCVFTSFTTSYYSQEQTIQRNSIYVEAFGQGLYNSFSFDHLTKASSKIKQSFTAGITLLPVKDLFVAGAPLSYNWLFGKTNHHLELGVGLTALWLRSSNIEVGSTITGQNGELLFSKQGIAHSNDLYSFVSPKIGYRFQKPTGGFFFRATFTPPLAGFNIEGRLKSSTGEDFGFGRRVSLFQSAAFFGEKAFPWAGISFGWTLK